MTTTAADDDLCYTAVRSRDARFDGVFYTAVRTTGVYCRPSCPARTPLRENVSFFATAAAAHESGFRACRRCRPDASPGSPEWDARADVVGRAMRMIRDGVVERSGVAGLADRLGYSERHVTRMLRAEVGAGPLSIARGERARTARVLLETTTTPVADVAFAAGFGSVRQFNETVREVYALSPRELRTRSGGRVTAPGTLRLRLAVRTPFDASGVLSFLDDHAVPGVEAVDGTTYSRVLVLQHGRGLVRLDLRDDLPVDCELALDDSRDTMQAVQRCRALLDLDADPVAVDATLAGDPDLASLVRAVPGLRVPGAVDGFETAARTVIGQQVSVSGARTVQARIVRAVTAPWRDEGDLTHAFPTAAELAGVDPTALPLPRQRGRALVGLARAVAGGEVDLEPGADPDTLRDALVRLPGIGPWTASYVTMRALGHPDVLVERDLVLDRMLARLGGDASRTASWRPWRSYATVHLWREARRLQSVGESP